VLCAPGILSLLILSGKGNYDCLLGPRGISARVRCSGTVNETIPVAMVAMYAEQRS
jgi:hypothetical protein